MNESKSARYHRLKRRAGLASLITAAAVLALMLWSGASAQLRDLALSLGGSQVVAIAAYSTVLAAVLEAAALPISFYQSFVLERRYELSSESTTAWVRDHFKAFALTTVLLVVAAEVTYSLIRWDARWWWLPVALIAASFVALMARLAPVILLPIFYKFTPLAREGLADRLLTLSENAGVRVLGVYEWGLGAKTRRATAALVGAGGTRRILLSDTLLAEYSDDEIEVILAHELAHHVHHDIMRGLLIEAALLAGAAYAAAAALSAGWMRLGLTGPSDIAGLPLLLLAAGAVVLAATPLVNALSRLNERRADRFALRLTNRADAFVSAMRRLSLQNLAEENPSRAVVWLFHTHPPIAERIANARSH